MDTYIAVTDIDFKIFELKNLADPNDVKAFGMKE